MIYVQTLRIFSLYIVLFTMAFKSQETVIPVHFLSFQPMLLDYWISVHPILPPDHPRLMYKSSPVIVYTERIFLFSVKRTRCFATGGKKKESVKTPEVLKFNSTSPRSFSPGCLHCLNECGATDWHSTVVNQLLKEFRGAFTLPHVIFSS